MIQLWPITSKGVEGMQESLRHAMRWLAIMPGANAAEVLTVDLPTSGQKKERRKMPGCPPVGEPGMENLEAIQMEEAEIPERLSWRVLCCGLHLWLFARASYAR